MKLRWLPHARADLRAIRAHVAEDSPINAERLLDRLIRRAECIPDFPQAGRVVPEFALDDVREIIESPYRIIYRIGNDRIDVLTVMHGARLLRGIPRR